jgi:hypothetical protein
MSLCFFKKIIISRQETFGKVKRGAKKREVNKVDHLIIQTHQTDLFNKSFNARCNFNQGQGFASKYCRIFTNQTRSLQFNVLRVITVCGARKACHERWNFQPTHIDLGDDIAMFCTRPDFNLFLFQLCPLIGFFLFLPPLQNASDSYLK